MNVDLFVFTFYNVGNEIKEVITKMAFMSNKEKASRIISNTVDQLRRRNQEIPGYSQSLLYDFEQFQLTAKRAERRRAYYLGKY